MKRTTLGAAGALLSASLAIAATAGAQQMQHMHMAGDASARALTQIEQVRAAAARLASTDSATTNGFRPVLNWLPTMGTHWINRSRQTDGKAVTLDAPDQLMFSPIDGRQQLVGAAYSYIVPLTDSTRPATFDGNPAWHDHPQFAPEGKTLAMLHVWFVPSPDGPFAGHNPNLPFWALGMTPPPAQRFMDPRESVRIRKTALALGALVDTAGLFPTLATRPDVQPVLASQREVMRKLVPQLDAKSVVDWTAWDRAADEAVASWDAQRAAYLGSVRSPAIRERLTRTLNEMETGAHAQPAPARGP